MVCYHAAWKSTKITIWHRVSAISVRYSRAGNKNIQMERGWQNSIPNECEYTSFAFHAKHTKATNSIAFHLKRIQSEAISQRMNEYTYWVFVTCTRVHKHTHTHMRLLHSWRHCRNRAQSACVAFEILHTFCVIIRAHKNGNICMHSDFSWMRAFPFATFFLFGDSAIYCLHHCQASRAACHGYIADCWNYLNGLHFYTVFASIAFMSARRSLATVIPPFCSIVTSIRLNAFSLSTEHNGNRI